MVALFMTALSPFITGKALSSVLITSSVPNKFTKGQSCFVFVFRGGGRSAKIQFFFSELKQKSGMTLYLMYEKAQRTTTGRRISCYGPDKSG
jgi:hypothetical protein